MKNIRKDFSLTECLIVLAMILFVTVIAIHNALLSVTTSEEQTVNSAKVEYAAVRNMYAGQNRSASVDPESTSATTVSSTPIH